MTNDNSNWYKNPYVWLIIFFPSLAIVAGIITINLAIISDDGLVSDDYYKEGLNINRILERDNVATEMELIASINMDREAKIFKLLLSANDHFQFPETINITYINKTRKGFDKAFQAMKTENNIYEATLPELIRGKWFVQIEADNWRLINTITTY